MKRIAILGVALLAVFGIVAGNAVTVSASGHEFIASKTAKTKSKQTDSQVFKTGSGTLECSKVSGTGEMKEGKSTAHKEVFTYSGCTAFDTKATMSPGYFEFNANGPVKLEKAITIVIGEHECEIEIESQTVEGAKYENKSGKVEAEADAFDIKSKAFGSGCGGSNSEGNFNGSVLGELEGGTVEWK